GRISSRAACCSNRSIAPRPSSPATPTTGPDLPISAGLFAQHRRGGLYVDMRIGVPVNQFPLAVLTAKHRRHSTCKRPNLRASRHPYLAAFGMRAKVFERSRIAFDEFFLRPMVLLDGLLKIAGYRGHIRSNLRIRPCLSGNSHCGRTGAPSENVPAFHLASLNSR